MKSKTFNPVLRLLVATLFGLLAQTSLASEKLLPVEADERV